MRAHTCCRGGVCDCPFAADGHGCPKYNASGQLVHECGVTVHPAFLEHPVLPRVNGRLKLSILTPTYNRHAEIVRAMRAALEQTYRPLEMVIMGDGPDPELWAVIHEWKLEHDLKGVQISTYCTGHRFAPLDRDKGGTPMLAASVMATGDIFAFVPDDDILLPTYAEDVVQAFEAGCDVYGSQCYAIDTKSGGRGDTTDRIMAWRWELLWWQQESFDWEKGTALAFWEKAGARFAYGTERTAIRHVEPSDKPEYAGSMR